MIVRTILKVTAQIVAIAVVSGAFAAPARDANGGTRESTSPKTSIGIASLEAFLFFGESGQVGTENVANAPAKKGGSPRLVNAPLGDNSEQGGSTAILVVVTVQGPGLKILQKKYELTLVAKAQGKSLLSQGVGGATIAPLKEGVFQKVPFVVHGTGCFPVTLTADVGIPGSKAESRLERVIPFGCND